MATVYYHRFLRKVICRIIDTTSIGYRVVECDLLSKRVREKVFGFLDFDPEVGCWILSNNK